MLISLFLASNCVPKKTPSVVSTPAATTTTTVVQSSTPAVDKKFRIAAVGKVSSLDPAQIETPAEKMIVSNLVDTLFQRNVQTGEIVPRACHHFEMTGDGLQWRFFLRQDLFWSNGNQIKAIDYENALRRLLKQKTNAKIARKLLAIQGSQEMVEGAFYNPDHLGIASMDMLKQSELDVTLSKPDPFFLQTLSDPATAPIPSDQYEIKQDQIFAIENYVSSGPFTVEQKNSTSYILQKNRHYRSFSGIMIDQVAVYTVSSIIEGEKMFLSGMIDEFGYPDLKLDGETLASLSGTKYVTFQPDLKTVFLRLNTKQSPLNQFQYRQALAMGVNHDLLMDLVGLEGQKPARSLIPDEVKFYDPPHGFYANPSQAKQTLTNLGYCEKNECTIAPKLKLIYPDTWTMKKIAGAIATQLKQTLNLNEIELKPMDVKTFVNAVEKGDYVFALDEISVTNDNIFEFLQSFITGNPLSGGYSNPDFDQLLLQASSSLNVADAERNYREAESLILRDIGVIPLIFEATPLLLHRRVLGYSPNIWDLHPFENIQLQSL